MFSSFVKSIFPHRRVEKCMERTKERGGRKGRVVMVVKFVRAC